MFLYGYVMEYVIKHLPSFKKAVSYPTVTQHLLYAKHRAGYCGGFKEELGIVLACKQFIAEIC